MEGPALSPIAENLNIYYRTVKFIVPPSTSGKSLIYKLLRQFSAGLRALTQEHSGGPGAHESSHFEPVKTSPIFTSQQQSVTANSRQF